MKRIKVCRGIEPNVGVCRTYRKTLLRLQNDFEGLVTRELYAEMAAAGLLDQGMGLDSAFSPKTAAEREAWKILKSRRLTARARSDPGAVMRFLQEVTAKKMAGWMARLSRAAQKAVEKFVLRMAADTTGAQRRALKDAGVARGAIDNAWTVPTVGKQSLSPQAAKILPELTQNNAALITKIGAADVERISSVIGDVMTQGGNFDDLRETLNATRGFDEARANRVVLDQMNKISQQVQAENAAALGIEDAIWRHVPGQYTSRESHIAMDGLRFNLREGIYDEEVGYHVVPGQLPFCRCIARMVLPKEILA